MDRWSGPELSHTLVPPWRGAYDAGHDVVYEDGENGETMAAEVVCLADARRHTAARRLPMHFDKDVTAAQLAVLWRWKADTFERMFGFPRQAPYPAALALLGPRAPVVRFGEVERAESGDDGTPG